MVLTPPRYTGSMLERAAPTLGSLTLIIGSGIAQTPGAPEADMPHGTVCLTEHESAPDGAWCWYQDERVIVDITHPDGPMLLAGTVSFDRTTPGESGDIDVLWCNLATGERGSAELHDQLQADDHNNPSFVVLPDGRYLALYSKHSSDHILRSRRSTRPHDPTAWEPEVTLNHNAPICYSNVFLLPDQHGRTRLFNASRSNGFDPNLFISYDDGESWSHLSRLVTGPDGNDAGGQRPYLKYAQHEDALHFVATDGHPRNEDNSIHHAILERGRILASDGSALGPLSMRDRAAHRVDQVTTIMRTGTTFNGVAMRHAWTIDLHVDDNGHPWTVFIARADNNDEDHRFLYARWDGERWVVRELCRAGAYLYKRENDYTGLAALHPNDPDRIVVSTNVDPRDDAPLAHYELFLGTTTDDGAQWHWQPLTWDSPVDNLRPVIPIWSDEQAALLWLHGSMKTYTDWNAEVMLAWKRDAHESMDDWWSRCVVADQPGVTRAAREPDALQASSGD